LRVGDIFIYQKSFKFNDIKIKLHPEVYDPAEDSFLIIESIQIKNEDRVFEIGTGCGLIALECARLGAEVICSDINPYAIKLVKKNYHENKFKLKGLIDVRYGNLFSVLNKNEKFDVIIFNPPYLPTDKNDVIDKEDWINIATNGGIDGLNLIIKYILKLKNHLRKNGNAYFTFSSLSSREKLNKYIIKTGLEYKIIKSRKYDDERIYVYSISYIN
jgi:release factor glutamine methyltransferase